MQPLNFYIRPSKTLLLIVCVFVLLCHGALADWAWVVWKNALDSSWIKVHFLSACGGACALLILVNRLVWRWLRAWKIARHVQVSTDGMQVWVDADSISRYWNDRDANPSEAWQLGAVTLLWPNLMVLDLRRSGGGRVALPILRDSVTSKEYRQLSIWLHWFMRKQSCKH